MAAKWKERDQVYRRYLNQAAGVYQARQDIRVFTELVLTLFTVIVFGLFAIKPTLTTIARLSAEIKDKKEILVKTNTKITNLGLAQGVFGTQISNIEILKRAIPEASITDEIIVQIEAIARKNN